MALDGDSLGSVPFGPQTEGLMAALGEATRVLNLQGAELLAGLDITSPTWDPNRPTWHLSLIERFYGVRPELTLAPDLRYRIARARVAARHSSGRLDDLTRVFNALVGVADVDPAKLRILVGPLVCYLVFRADAAPPASVQDRVIDLLRTAIQDVAGYGIITAPDGVSLDALFTLDVGPGLDVGILAAP